jgi:carboxyl-terminal processing protease
VLFRSDYQKRFLLASDVKQLEAFGPYIDDNLLHGKISLPDAGFDILNEKIGIIEKYIDSILVDNTVSYKKTTAQGAPAGKEELWVGSFNIDQNESYETDPEKLNFAVDLGELKDRWRKIIKAQVVSQYLDMVDEQTKKLSEAKEKAEQNVPAVKSDEELWKEAVAKVAKRNKNFFQRLHQETLQDHYDRFFDCIARAFDPHTNYNPPAVKEQFDIEMRGSLEGIGAILQEEDGYIKVVRIIPGSASARQGKLKAEDIILQVAQENGEPVDVTDMRLRDAVRMIRGPKGEAVTLTVKKPDNTTAVVKIVRDVVQIEETFVRSTTFKAKDGKIGRAHV